MEPVTTDQLIDDLKTVVRDAEALLHATAGQAGERIGDARSRAEESLRAARARLDELGADLGGRARAAARTADEYVRENPWTAIAIAAGIGFLAGLLGRRR